MKKEINSSNNKINIFIFITISCFIFFTTNSNIKAQTNTDNTYFFDQANIFSQNPDGKRTLIRDLENANQEENLELKIITINSLENQNINNYCAKIYSELAKPNIDSITLVYSKKENKIFSCKPSQDFWQIDDGEIYYILNDIVQPNIINNNLLFGLRIGVKKIIEASKQDIGPASNNISDILNMSQKNKQISVLLFIIIFLSWLAAFFGKTKQWWLGGVIGFSLGLFIWWISKIWFFMPLFLTLGLLYDYIVSQHYKEYREGKKGKFWCKTSNLKNKK